MGRYINTLMKNAAKTVRKVLFIWDVKSEGSPLALFCRVLKGYNYETESGRSHSSGILDELPEGTWEIVGGNALVVEKKHAARVERLFKEFSAHVEWRKFEVEI